MSNKIVLLNFDVDGTFIASSVTPLSENLYTCIEMAEEDFKPAYRYTNVNGVAVLGDKFPEYVATVEDIAAEAQAETNKTNIAYLASTDWYITRQQETGAAIPTDVTTKRAEAREAIQ